MPKFRARRSCRVALSIPIRVFGTDYRGVVFTEDTVTIVVNLHGAKIRMTHQLLPDQEILLFSHPTRQDALFRVVSKVQSADRQYTYWGIENLEPKRNIWGVDFPELQARDQLTVRVVLQCPNCSVREFVWVDDALLAAFHEKGGLPRGCLTCKTSGLWKLLPFHEV
jgi:hypothetical protein